MDVSNFNLSSALVGGKGTATDREEAGNRVEM